MYYIGTTPSDVAAGFIKRYFYGLRRNDDGELFLQQLDQLRLGQENVVIVDHEQLYPNLRYQQFKWENRSLLYYIEESTGFFIQRISEAYTYPDKNSSPGYGSGDDSLVLVNSSSEQIGY